jgi:hypothetical protein
MCTPCRRRVLASRHRCVNLEDQIITRLPGAISDPEEAAKALAVAQYYFYGPGASASSTGSGSGSAGSSGQSGGGLEAVLLAAFDFDVAAMLQRINSTRQELLQVPVRRVAALLALQQSH